MIDIPLEQLSSEALEGLVDEFILREGTDYGVVEISLESKRQQILNQLKRGQVKIVFDQESESITLIAVPERY